MTEDIFDERVDRVSNKTKYFFDCYDDGLECSSKEFEDDCFIHICYKKYRFSFYNGQERGCLTEKDIPKFKKIVRDAFKKPKTW